jgi:hypothetical protein
LRGDRARVAARNRDLRGSDMYPDFLGIGAQKCGTTWLYDNLARHPDIWMPPVKEMHYLDHRPPLLVTRLLSRSSHHRAARVHLRNCLLAAWRGGSRADLAWAARYCLSPRDDRWYGSLFPKTEGHISGEICPGYARLGPDEVGHVHKLMPEAKIIYLLRNPVERAWSALAHHFREHYAGGIETIPESEIEARLHKPKSWRHGEYLKNLAAWEAHYPSDQIFIGFFDDLQESPKSLLGTILDFLKVDGGEQGVPGGVETRRNPGRGEEVPPQLERVLARAFADEVRGLNDRFDNAHTRRWLAYTEARL